MPYYSVNQYLKDRFGQKVYKIAVDAGCTCPNRDGTLDTRGCIFCSAYGSGDYAQNRNLSITEQINQGKKLVSKKADAQTKYIAYFQAFSNTYGPFEKLQAQFLEALVHPDIVALSIATRPDCLSPEMLFLLEKLNRMKPIWVELGLQTIHVQSAAYIRRGYPLSVYDQAVQDLAAIGIEQIITHVIIGLPHESKTQILETIQYVTRSKSNGIKLQLLHVLQHTDLAKDYAAGLFEVLSMEEYTDIIADAVSLLPEHMVIHRLTGDGNRKDLIAPLWSLRKWTVLNMINKKIAERENKDVKQNISLV